MDKNLGIITFAVTLIIKAAIMAARFSGRVRKRSLKRLAAMDAETTQFGAGVVIALGGETLPTCDGLSTDVGPGQQAARDPSE